MNSEAQHPDPSEHDARAGAADVDPWVDFLSEASEELDVLNRELLAHGEAPDEPAWADHAALPPSPDTRASVPPATPPRSLSSVVIIDTRHEPSMFPAEGPSRAPVGQAPGVETAPTAIAGVTAGRDDRPVASDDAGPASRQPNTALTAPGSRNEPDAIGQVLPGLSLADVLARQVPVGWEEAVALVEEFCAALAEDDATPGVPDPKHVRITPLGEVLLTAGGSCDREIRAVGRLLHALLATASPPLPLRLFVTSSISSPRFESLDLYADALSYYAVHPPRARRAAIRALYCRALAAPVLPQVRRMSQPAVSPDAWSSHVVRRRGQKVLQAVAACVAIAASAAAGAWIGRVATPPPRASDSAAASSAVLPIAIPLPEPSSLVADEEPSAAAVSNVRTRRPDAAGSEATPRPLPARGGPWPVDAAPAAPQATPDARAVRMSLPREEPTAVLARATFGVNQKGGTHAPAESPEPVDAAVLRAAATIYSSADVNVDPPVVLSPGGLTLPEPLPDSAAPVPIELLINENGEVEEASFVDRPATLLEMMRLSSLKYQKFRPAMKDGVPVPYRLYVR